MICIKSTTIISSIYTKLRRVRKQSVEKSQGMQENVEITVAAKDLNPRCCDYSQLGRELDGEELSLAELN